MLTNCPPCSSLELEHKRWSGVFPSFSRISTDAPAWHNRASFSTYKDHHQHIESQVLDIVDTNPKMFQENTHRGVHFLQAFSWARWDIVDPSIAVIMAALLCGMAGVIAEGVLNSSMVLSLLEGSTTE